MEPVFCQCVTPVGLPPFGLRQVASEVREIVALESNVSGKTSTRLPAGASADLRSVSRSPAHLAAIAIASLDDDFVVYRRDRKMPFVNVLDASS
ncbi:MAG: hypothetical protein AAF978_11065 [Cyanobacteria bacterium P01_E01_bin.48]